MIDPGVTVAVGGRVAVPLATRVAGTIAPPYVRHFLARWRQGCSSFALPWGRICVVIPERLEPSTGDCTLSEHDVAGRDVVADLMRRCWYREKADWHVQTLRPDSDLPVEISARESIISICGPANNPLTHRLLSRRDRMLREVEFVDGGDRQLREFHWRNRAYRWNNERDYALIAIKWLTPPGGRRRRVVLLFGLRDVGTLAAAQVFASPEYRDLRRQIQKSHALFSNEVEVLLRVEQRIGQRRATEIAVATEADGERLPNSSQVARPIDPNTRSLQAIYHSLKRNPRPFVLGDVRHEFIFAENGDVEIIEEATWTAEDRDIVYYLKVINGDAPLESLEAVGFRATITNAAGDLATLPAENLPTSKRFLLFPLPPVTPGAKSPRVAMRALWPGGAKRLQTVGERDEFSVSVSEYAARPVDQIKVVFRFANHGASYRVSEQFKHDAADATREYGAIQPYECVLTEVAPGRRISWSLERLR